MYAITKLKKLDLIGEYEAPDDIEYKIQVKVSPEKKTIQIIDNGIGMTKEEVNEYINQIAFSGAEAFLEKYKDKTNEDQIIGSLWSWLLFCFHGCRQGND